MNAKELSDRIADLAKEARDDCPEIATCLFALAGSAAAGEYWQGRMLSAISSEARLFVAAAEQSRKIYGDGGPN